MPVHHVSSLPDFKRQLSAAGSKLVVVDFHATWCGPCKAIAPLVEQLSSQYATRAVFLKVDVDDAQDVAQSCSVSAMPTFHFYRMSRLVHHFSGADQARLRDALERYAPSAADVSFSGAGRALGAASASASASAAAAPANRAAGREAAAAAAAARLQAAENPAQDADTGPAAAPATAGASKNDARLKVDQGLLKRMTDELGFPPVRAEKALILTGNRALEPAVEWCFEHADDPDVDEPLSVVTADGAPKKRLTPEEAKKKADDLYERARERRKREEKEEERSREKDRIRSSKEVTVAKAKLEAEERKRAIAEKKREKMEALKERQRVREMLEADKARRRERFNMPGASSQPAPPPQPKREPPAPVASAGKIQFRLPDGSRLEGEFEPEQTMSDLVAFLTDAKPQFASNTYAFSQQYPRRKFTTADYGSTLAELGLLPRGALTVLFS